MTISELKSKLDTINYDFRRLLKDRGIWDYGELSSEITKNLSSADDYFLANELFAVMREIESANHLLDFLSRKITGEYTIHKNSRGRYECEAREFTSGSVIEYYAYDEYYERYQWVKSRVEYDSKRGDYYIVGANELSLEGIKVRIRELV